MCPIHVRTSLYVFTTFNINKTVRSTVSLMRKAELPVELLIPISVVKTYQDSKKKTFARQFKIFFKKKKPKTKTK